VYNTISWEAPKNQTKSMGEERAECRSFKLMVPHLFGGMFVNIPGVTVTRVHSLFWGLNGTFPILTSFLQLHHILRGENKHKTTIIIKREYNF
jgi:hypothetical protein